MKLSRTISCSILLMCTNLVFVNLLFSQSTIKVSEFGSNPGNLEMYLYGPPGSDTLKSLPLVVVLHGCLQSAKAVASLTGWNQLAERYGFYVIYPQQKLANNSFRCYCWYNSNDIEAGQGENLSIRQMIDYVMDNKNVDTSRIFVTGLSAGAAMGVVLMADYPSRFNSGAIFAGGPYKTATHIWTAMMSLNGWRIKSPQNWGDLVREQHPKYVGNYPRMIIYHGRGDLVVNRRNATQLVKQWTNLHGISPEPSEIIKRFSRARNIDKLIYKTTDHQEVVSYYKVRRQGHSLLINPGDCDQQGGKRGVFSSDKNFHSTYWTAVDFGLIQTKAITGKSTVKREEQGLVYSVEPTNLSTYKWFFPKGCNIVSGADTREVIVNWGSVAGNVDVEETRADGCVTKFTTLNVRIKGK